MKDPKGQDNSSMIIFILLVTWPISIMEWAVPPHSEHPCCIPHRQWSARQNRTGQGHHGHGMASVAAQTPQCVSFFICFSHMDRRLPTWLLFAIGPSSLQLGFPLPDSPYLSILQDGDWLSAVRWGAYFNLSQASLIRHSTSFQALLNRNL